MRIMRKIIVLKILKISNNYEKDNYFDKMYIASENKNTDLLP